MQRRFRWATFRIGMTALLLAMLVTPLGSVSAAQHEACELLAPWELSELTGAPFAAGESTASGCVWRTETRAGHVLTVSLDISGQNAVVTIESDDPAIDANAAAEALMALVADRIAAGATAPPAPPAAVGSGERPDLCELFPLEDVAAMMGVRLKPYGSMGLSACGYLSDEPERILIDVVIVFQPGSLSAIPSDWPDAVEIDVAGLPALEYGWDLGAKRTSYVSVEVEPGLLTAKVTYDDTDLDPAAVARDLVERVLAAMGQPA